MSFARHASCLLLSLLAMLIVIARVRAQGIPVPAETSRAGAYAPSGVKARSSKPTWRPKGSVIPAQAELPVLPEPTPAPEYAEPPSTESTTEAQSLRGPANAAESTADQEGYRNTNPSQVLPLRANPLRQTRRPQTYQQRSPYQRVQNPVDLEVDAEPVPRPDPPRMLQDVPGPQGQSLPRQQWQIAPGQRYPAPPASRIRINGEPTAERHDYPPDIDNPTASCLDGQYPNGQIPGEELYGMPRVFETNAYGRFTGRGEPLTAGSWLNRPYYVGGFIGGISGDTLIAGEINQNGAFFWGGNLGWDYDSYWGLEMRLAFASEGLDYFANPAFDNAANDLVLWDTSFVYYPWGDARWRPYVKLGFGFADFDFTDVSGLRHSEMVYEMPFGIGLKYRVNQYWVWRFDATDNLIFGGNAGLETQNQFSLSAGLEYRFGGRRQSYWPWNPSRRWR